MQRENEIDRLETNTLMQPDVLVPAQFHADVRALSDPERRIRLAVLENAIRCFQRHFGATDPRERALYEDAVDWFSRTDGDEPYAFENVCDALHLDPDRLRQGLCRWRAAEQARRARLPLRRDDRRMRRATKARRIARHLRAA